METYDSERKYILDEEQQFRALARRNRELGMWVAAKIGKSGPDATAYALTVVQADLAEAGEEDLFRKVRADLDAAGVAISDQEIRTTMVSLLQHAASDLATE
jgi:hypothetical protein